MWYDTQYMADLVKYVGVKYVQQEEERNAGYS
jgi:hypothetical protein